MMTSVTDDLRQRVEREIRRRGSSARQVALAAGKSNTSVSNWLAGGNLGAAVRTAVSVAFGWPMDWPENLPAEPVPLEVVSQLDEIEARQLEQAEAMAEMLRLLKDVHDAVRRPPSSTGSARSTPTPHP